MIKFFLPISYRNISQYLLVKKVRTFFSMALRYSIQIKRELISNDILILAKHKFIQISITEVEMEVLLLNKMYDMIERLILGNTLLETDASHLDVDEIFQAQRLSMK